MNITPEQKHALDSGEAINVTVDGLPCVVLPQEKYDRVQQLIEGDDRDFDPREMYPLILKALDADDENPEQYLEYLDDQPR
jgi:hypothetical protein